MAVLINCKLHAPGGDLTVCSRLLTAEEARRLREGTVDDAAIREAMYDRLMPSMLEVAVERFHLGVHDGILWRSWRETPAA